ncbi:unnamed protein product [Thelazia callipaeda]|uniref:Sequestosome-1 n=1 Tax=Thelazia callipaeda TaxID=103827 RepID=A0A0N5D6I1_THECL|nr:unnamed protein product [Thelazia callipaeda]
MATKSSVKPPTEVVSVKWEHFGTLRRFQLKIDKKSDLFSILLSKIRSLVGTFEYSLGWKDEDGDVICFSSDEELRDALHYVNNCLRIHTIAHDCPTDESKGTAKKSEKVKENHPHVTCNHCNQPVFGIRYKCGVCDDFDLCEECEKEGVHAYHGMFRYATPRTPKIETFPRLRRKWRHSGGCRDPFMQDVFGQTAATAAHVAQQAAQQASKHIAEYAAKHAATVTRQFADSTGNASNNVNNPPQYRKSVAQSMEYLKEFGTHIQQALANFGIEVDMEVEQNDTTEKQQETNNSGAECKETNNSGAECKREDSSGMKKNEQLRNDSEVIAQKDDNSETENEAGKRRIDGQDSKIESDNLHVPMKKMHISDDESVKCDLKKSEHSTFVDEGSDEWTLMGVTGSAPPLSPAASDESCKAGTPFIVPLSGPHNPHCHFIYPDKKIALCVEQLEGMGFDNCNGWLTKLAADYGGEIDSVIENMIADPAYIRHYESYV